MFLTITTAIPPLPVEERHIEQWQTKTSDTSVLTLYLTEPQLHFTFNKMPPRLVA